MRIISDFTDYYDGIGQHGIDTELMYVRRMVWREIETIRPDRQPADETARHLTSLIESGMQSWRGDGLDRKHTHLRQHPTWDEAGYALEPRIVIAGDQAWACIVATPGGWGWKTGECPETIYAATPEQMHQAATGEPRRTRLAVERYWAENMVSTGAWAPRSRIWEHERAWAESAVEPIRAVAGEEPVLVIRNAGSRRGAGALQVIANASLIHHGANKRWNAWEAHQLVMRHLAIANDPGHRMASVDDASLASQKGFDKWSFRRHPEESAKHRRRERRADGART